MKRYGILLSFCALAACAPATSLQETIVEGNDGFDVVNPIETPIEDEAPPILIEARKVVTESTYDIRTLRSEVLDFVVSLPAGSEVMISDNAQVENHPFRNSAGNPEFSSTGFIPIIEIKKVPAGAQGKFTPEYLKQLHSMAGGIYVSAVVAQGSNQEAMFPAVKPGKAGAGYNAYFAVNGKPKNAYTTALTKRFGNRLNKGTPMSQLPGTDQVKWTKIYAELNRVGARLVETPRSLLMLDINEAKKRSLAFEQTGVVSPEGAWSIAVQGTAVRHGFANVPCAEFMSEVIRQAYKRAGYSHFTDFTKARGNTLSYANGAAAVVNLATYLDKAGWVPWNSAVYIPKTGAIMMHAQATTPGHAYMSGGDNGRIIVDNGMPQGRDLRVTAEKTLRIMYQHGVFFLPPGILPDKW